MMSHAHAPHRISSLPVLVIFPHNRCNCRCLMCDIWKIREKQEITAADIARQVDSLRVLGVKWIVFSGGEAQLHSDLHTLAEPLRAEGIRLTLLTAGLLLESRAAETAELFDDVIVSLDGPAAVHDAIRRVPNAFSRLAAGIARLRLARPELPVAARCTVQKQNHTALRAAVRTAHELQLDSVSFLAADTTSSAFNRTEPMPIAGNNIGLDASELAALSAEVEALIREHAADIANGFIRENAPKLRRIVHHFRAALGQLPAVAPRCNAPWVSSVIEADGAVRPCFFQPAIGNLRDGPLTQILNSDAALRFRANLDVASNPICRRCVCSLYVAEKTQTREAAFAG